MRQLDIPGLASTLLLVLLVAVCSLQAPSVHAISQQDAGVHDWHLPLIGQPHASPELGARFHYPAGRTKAAVSALVYVATEKNVLAAVEPRLGDVVWRHQFPKDQALLRYVLHGDDLLALTGPAAAELHLISASTGHVQWSVKQHSIRDGLLPEPGSVAADAVFLAAAVDGSGAQGTPDVISMAGGREVRRIDGRSGQVKWTWVYEHSKDATTQIHKILPSGSRSPFVQLLLIERQTGAYSLKTVALDIQTGQATTSAPSPVKSVTLEKLQSVLVLPPLPDTAEPRLAYLDTKGQVKSVFFFSDGAGAPIVSSYSGPAADRFDRLLSVGLDERGIFVAVTKDDTATIFQVGGDGKPTMLHHWSDSVTEPIFDGFIDRDGKSHVSRFSISRVLGLASMSTYSVEATEHSEAGIIYGSTFPYAPSKYGRILSVTAEIAARRSPSLLSRTCITTASGSFQGWLGPGLQWSREEGLAHLSTTGKTPSVAFLPITTSKQLAEPTSDEASFSAIALAKQFSLSLFNALLSLSGQHAEKSLSTAQGRDWLKEAFGYSKLVIAATEFGKVYALDLGNGGKVVWENYLVQVAPSTTTAEAKSGTGPYHSVNWKRIAVFDELEGGQVVVVAVAEVADTRNQRQTIVFTLNGLTGQPLSKGRSQETLFDGAVKEVLVLHGSANPTLLILSEDNNLIRIISPPGLHTTETDASVPVPQITIADVSNAHSIAGVHTLIPEGEKNLKGQIAWRYALPAGETIQAFARQSNGPVASAGRVKGDRSTIYKYLNPHLVAVAAISSTDDKSLAVYLLDTVSGRLVWSTRHHGVAAANVAMTLSDNWLVYAYAGAGEGHQSTVVSVELYEEEEKDVKSEHFSSHDDKIPYALSRSFVFPARVTAMATSQTLRGITTKALLVSTTAGQVVAVPRRYLDPRRTLHKPTKADMEEYLMAYDPVIPIDPKWVITHKNSVQGVEGILSSPTILESTSQVFAYGLDLFGSSVSPSGRFDVLSQEFNKLQLVATSLGLLAAVAILRPMVKRKELKERWYPAT